MSRTALDSVVSVMPLVFMLLMSQLQTCLYRRWWYCTTITTRDQQRRRRHAAHASWRSVCLTRRFACGVTSGGAQRAPSALPSSQDGCSPNTGQALPARIGSCRSPQARLHCDGRLPRVMPAVLYEVCLAGMGSTLRKRTSGFADDPSRLHERSQTVAHLRNYPRAAGSHAGTVAQTSPAPVADRGCGNVAGLPG